MAAKNSLNQGEQIIKLATKIMAKGARGWSDAMAQARLQIQKESSREA